MVFRVLVVCVGNVCRSPVGERLLAARLDPARFEVASAGVRALAGSAMDEHSFALLEEYGANAEGFTARQLGPAMVKDADLVLTATREIRGRVLEESPGALRRTFTVRELAALIAETGQEAGKEAGKEADQEAGSRPAASGTWSDPSELVRRLAGERSRVGHLDLDIPDPIGENRDTHRVSAEMMARSVQTIVEALE